jgi:hypothetical protein
MPQLIAYVENTIHMMNDRKMPFQIVFFNDNEDICVPKGADLVRAAKYRLVRNLLQLHLLRFFPVRVFPSVKSMEFLMFVVSEDVWYVVCHDGEGLFRCEQDPVLPSEQRFDVHDASANLALTKTACTGTALLGKRIAEFKNFPFLNERDRLLLVVHMMRPKAAEDGLSPMAKMQLMILRLIGMGVFVLLMPNSEFVGPTVSTKSNMSIGSLLMLLDRG